MTVPDRRSEVVVDGPDGNESLALRLSRPARATGVVLYLHGFGSSQDGEKARFFRERSLELGLAFASFDFRGHGRSTGGMLRLSLSRCLDDVAAVRQHLAAQGLGSSILFGSSLGGLVGLWSATGDPSGVAAGVFLAPALGLREAIAGWVGGEGLARWRRDGRLEVANDLGTWDIGWNFYADLESYPPDRLARECPLPSLLLQGVEDDQVSWQRIVEFCTCGGRRQRELHLFADGDHRLLDRLDRLWRLTADFVEIRCPEWVAMERKTR